MYIVILSYCAITVTQAADSPTVSGTIRQKYKRIIQQYDLLSLSTVCTVTHYYSSVADQNIIWVLRCITGHRALLSCVHRPDTTSSSFLSAPPPPPSSAPLWLFYVSFVLPVGLPAHRCPSGVTISEKGRTNSEGSPLLAFYVDR